MQTLFLSSDSDCFTCGQKGHLSRDCPSAESGKECYTCGQKGHISRDCPDADSKGDDYKSETGCYKCGKDGHIARDCGTQKCYRCGKSGHFARDCEDSSTICYKCNKAGHFARDCTTEGQACYNCGKTGHLKRDCTEKSDIDVKCYRCNEVGHYARDCPNDQEWDITTAKATIELSSYWHLILKNHKILTVCRCGFVKIILVTFSLSSTCIYIYVIIIKGCSKWFTQVEVALRYICLTPALPVIQRTNVSTFFVSYFWTEV